MSLLKKTFVLQGQPPKGYLTALKIGATRGVKLSLNSVAPNMTLAVKIGSENPEVFPIRALKEEFRVTPDFDEKTEFRAVVFENESVFAYTGNSPVIAYGSWIKKEMTESIPVYHSSDTQTANSRDSSKTVTQQTAQNLNDSTRTEPPVRTQSARTNESIAPNSAFKAAATAVNPAAGEMNEGKAMPEGVYFEPVLKEESNAKTETVDAEVMAEKETENQFRFFKKQTESHFYDRVRSRMDEMLVVHPKEESLEKLIPESKWVRVPYAPDEFYVVGVLTDSGKVTHIGYGVKGLRSVFPPKEAESLSEFLPTEGDQGYWLMFQDAETGEMLPVD